MRNLFMCHSQYNLILATAIATERFKDDENDLILFSGFLMTPELSSSLDEIFPRNIRLKGIFPKKNIRLQNKIKNYPLVVMQMKKFMCKKYDNVFLVADSFIPELFAMKYARKYHASVVFNWIEDGAVAYCAAMGIDRKKGFNRNAFSKKIKSFVLNNCCGLQGFFVLEKGHVGTNGNITNVYVNYPLQLLPCYKEKKKIEIMPSEFRRGMNELFSSNVKLEDNSILFLIDKLESSTDVQKWNEILMEIFEDRKATSKRIYLKYHPREEYQLMNSPLMEKVDSSICVEAIYASNMNKNIIVVGSKSSGLYTACRLGFETYTILREIGVEDEELFRFYENIGVRQW